MPLEPNPWSKRTICFGASPERGLRLAPFTILDNGLSAATSCAPDIRTPTSQPMNLDDLLHRYFGTSQLSEASPPVREAGVDRLRVDLGLETDRKRRFALWSLLYMLGHAPDLDVAFKEKTDRDAARTFMDLLAASETE